MTEQFLLQIVASGPIGCGKTKVINAIVDMLANNKEFVVLDGRYNQFSVRKGDEDRYIPAETQSLDLRLAP